MMYSLHRSIHLLFALVLLFLAHAAPLAAQTDDILAFSPLLSVQVGGIQEFVYTQSAINSGKARPIPPMESRFAIHRRINSTWIDLLPVVFFDQGSGMIPERYRQFFSRTETYGFSEHENSDLTLSWNRLAKYYDLLNILAVRMIRMKKGKIALQGYYTDEPGEYPLLADERAMSVRNYLCDVWRIDSSRIVLRPAVNGGVGDVNFQQKEEYRRVVITADSGALFDPVSYTASEGNEDLYHLRMTIDPKSLPESVRSIVIELRWHGQLLGSAIVDGSADSMLYRLSAIWKIPRRTNDITYHPIEVQGTIYYSDGRSRRTNTVPFRAQIQFDSASLRGVTFSVKDRIGDLHEEKTFRRRLRFLDLEDGEERRWSGTEPLEPLIDALASFCFREGRTMSVVVTSQTDGAQLSTLDPSAILYPTPHAPTSPSDLARYSRMLADSNYSLPLYILPDPLSLRAPADITVARKFVSMAVQNLMAGTVYRDAEGSVVEPLYVTEGEAMFARQMAATYQVGEDQLLDYMRREGERQQRVVEYIRSRVDSGVIESVELNRFSAGELGQGVSARDHFPPSYPIFPLPEQRMYHRQMIVEIIVSGE